MEFIEPGWAETTSDDTEAGVRCLYCKQLAVASLNPARLTTENANFSKYRYINNQIHTQTGYIQCYPAGDDDDFDWICSKECEALHELAK